VRKEPARSPTSTTVNVLPRGTNAPFSKQTPSLIRHGSCSKGAEGDIWLDLLRSYILESSIIRSPSLLSACTSLTISTLQQLTDTH
jgi:hypothetical protein